MICVFCKYQLIHWGDPILRYMAKDRYVVDGRDYRSIPATSCSHIETADESTL